MIATSLSGSITRLTPASAASRESMSTASGVETTPEGGQPGVEATARARLPGCGEHVVVVVAVAVFVERDLTVRRGAGLQARGCCVPLDGEPNALGETGDDKREVRRGYGVACDMVGDARVHAV